MQALPAGTELHVGLGNFGDHRPCPGCEAVRGHAVVEIEHGQAEGGRHDEADPVGLSTRSAPPPPPSVSTLRGMTPGVAGRGATPGWGVQRTGRESALTSPRLRTNLRTSLIFIFRKYGKLSGSP